MQITTEKTPVGMWETVLKSSSLFQQILSSTQELSAKANFYFIELNFF